MLAIPVTLQPSLIHGLGVFTVHAVSSGDVVSRFVPQFDVEYTAEELLELGDVERTYLRHYSYRNRFTGRYILPGDHDRFMNHADAANVGMNPDGSYTCIALRDIAAGEELTCDYRTFDAEWRQKLAPACSS
jgi:uncharacterized protein